MPKPCVRVRVQSMPVFSATAKMKTVHHSFCNELLVGQTVQYDCSQTCAPPPVSSDMKIYSIQQDDSASSCWDIAKQQCGNGNLWQDVICEAHQSNLCDNLGTGVNVLYSCDKACSKTCPAERPYARGNTCCKETVYSCRSPVCTGCSTNPVMFCPPTHPHWVDKQIKDVDMIPSCRADKEDEPPAASERVLCEYGKKWGGDPNNLRLRCISHPDYA